MSAKPDVSKLRLSPQDLDIFQRLERSTEQLEDECRNAYAVKEWGDHGNEKLLPENKHVKKNGRMRMLWSTWMWRVSR